MGASGTMDLTGASTAPGTTLFENGGTPNQTGDVYFYNVNLSTSTFFAVAGNFEFLGGNETSFSATPDANLPGSLSFNTTNGQFTYVVTQTDLIGAGITTGDMRDIFVTGSSATAANDTDALRFNYILCFAEGTGIATPKGETAVEALQISGLVRTADGRDVPVKWVGRVTAKPMFNPADRLAPVKIAAGAFGDTPHTDLIVTADHGMVLDERIINASALVNGTTVTWLDWKQLGERVTYYHVETEAHDIILSHGAASETYLDVPDRRSFDNYAEYVAQYGADAPIQATPMPRISSARLVPPEVRRRLSARGVVEVRRQSGN